MRLSPSHLGRMVFCVALFAAGCVALYITATTNAEFGSSLAQSEAAKAQQWKSALFVDGFLALLAMVPGIFWLMRARVAAVLSGFVVLAYVGYSITSIVGFGASERIAKSRMESGKVESQAAAARERNAQAVKQSDEQLKWLRETIVETRNPNRREQLLNEAKEASKVVPTIEAVPDPKQVMTDAQAEVLASILQREPEEVQLMMIAWQAILLILGKALGFGLSSALWPVSENGHSVGPPKGKERSDPKDNPKVFDNDDSKVGSSRQSPPRKKPVLTVVQSSAQLALPPPSKHRHDHLRKIVENFMDEAIDRAPPRVRTQSKNVYDRFLGWAAEKGYEEPPVTHKRLGMIFAEMGIRKDDKGSVVKYIGVALREPMVGNVSVAA